MRTTIAAYAAHESSAGRRVEGRDMDAPGKGVLGGYGPW